MIVPIRCMNCGYVIADKWRWFQARVAELRKEARFAKVTGPMYMDGTSVPVTPEGIAMEELGLPRYCCRMKFLTGTDLNEKV